MPQLALYKNLIFFIVMHDLTERYHVHITNTKKGRQKTAKVWLDNLEIFEKGSLSKKELKDAVNVLEAHQNEMITQIEKVRKGIKVKPLKFK